MKSLAQSSPLWMGGRFLGFGKRFGASEGAVEVAGRGPAEAPFSSAGGVEGSSVVVDEAGATTVVVAPSERTAKKTRSAARSSILARFVEDTVLPREKSGA